MKMEFIKPGQALVSQFGQRTRAYAVLELDHDGNTHTMIQGSLIDATYLKETFQQALQRIADRNNSVKLSVEDPEGSK